MSNAHNHILQDIRWRFRGGIICLDDCDVNFLLNQIDQVEELEARLQQYKLYEVMVVGATAQAREFGAGVVTADSLMRFREMALEEVGDD